jgi:transcriptional regulator with XRE-family HTH domain
MTTDRINGHASGNRLGAYLKDRRTKLDPAAFGLHSTRRRTPGLRREEVAQRANISPARYTWLEQGRGGAPSADVLNRIAGALMLTNVEREHLFLLGLGRLPVVHYQKNEGVTPRLQRVLERLEPTPALIRTALWDVIAWNSAATVMMPDDGSSVGKPRNLLRALFLDPRLRTVHPDWESVARFVVGAFRVDAARAGASTEVQPLIDELSELSPEFKAMWRDHDVSSASEAVKHIRHPVLGALAFEVSAFLVDGRPDLTLLIYNPATQADADKIRMASAAEMAGVTAR